MSSFIVFLVLFVSFNIVESASVEEENAFREWRTEFDIIYGENSSGQDSYEVAFKNFCINRKRIEEHNQRYFNCEESYALGLWKKSDRNVSELNLELNGLRLALQGRAIYVGGTIVTTANVTSLNYVNQGYVTSVQDQGNCGSCWAFATTGALEAQIFKKSKKLTKLSEQQLIDCSKSYGNLGCTAGVVGYAYKYIQDNGITTSSRYPYKGSDLWPCAYSKNMKNATVSGYNWVYVANEIFLRDLLFSVGPLAFGLDASLFTFQAYKTGIYNDTDCNGNVLNHAMLLVGFGTDPQFGDYWLVKNSYGKSWGEGGYMRMARGYNRCGIRNYIVFPRL